MMVASKSDLCKDFGGIALVCERCELHVIYRYYILQSPVYLMAMIKTLDLSFIFFQVSASSESMYDDAYTLQHVLPEDVHNFNYVAGMVPFLFNLIQDVCIKSDFCDFSKMFYEYM